MGGAMKTAKRSARKRNPESGISIMEVLVATVILVVGLVSLLGLFAQAIAVTAGTKDTFTAKQKAREALEGVYASRNDTSITFDQIQNVSNGGIFKDGFQAMMLNTTNGVVGSTSDGTTMDSVTLAGPDGILGTGDDIVQPLTNFSRQILIQSVIKPDGSVNPDLRQLTVTVRVATNGKNRDYTVQGYISRFP